MKNLADILATAPVLKKCDISNPSSGFPTKVYVSYATEGIMGTIVLNVCNYSGSVIRELHRRETNKQKAYHKMEII